jgi:hypothetical protein
MTSSKQLVVIGVIVILSIDLVLDICDNVVMEDDANPYSQALDRIYEQLAADMEKREGLQLQLAEAERHLDDLRDAAQSIGRLANVDPIEARPDLFPEDSEPELGFTDAIRKVFTDAAKREPVVRVLFDPISIRDELEQMGFPLERYRNPLASIHTILRRLVEQKEVHRVVLEDQVRYGAESRLTNGISGTRRKRSEPKPPATVRG